MVRLAGVISGFADALVLAHALRSAMPRTPSTGSDRRIWQRFTENDAGTSRDTPSSSADGAVDIENGFVTDGSAAQSAIELIGGECSSSQEASGQRSLNEDLVSRSCSERSGVGDCVGDGESSHQVAEPAENVITNCKNNLPNNFKKLSLSKKYNKVGTTDDVETDEQDDEHCSICFARMDKTAKDVPGVVASLPCSHAFHKQCILGVRRQIVKQMASGELDNTREHKARCPLCRRSFGTVPATAPQQHYQVTVGGIIPFTPAMSLSETNAGLGFAFKFLLVLILCMLAYVSFTAPDGHFIFRATPRFDNGTGAFDNTYVFDDDTFSHNLHLAEHNHNHHHH